MVADHVQGIHRQATLILQNVIEVLIEGKFEY